MRRLDKFERIFTKIARNYVRYYKDHSFKFYFDDFEYPIIGNSKKVVKVWFKDSKRVFSRIFREGSLGLGKSYCEGLINVADKDYKYFLFIFVRSAFEKRILLWLSPIDILRVVKARFVGRSFTYGDANRDINSGYSLSNWFDSDDDSNTFHLIWLKSKYVQYTCAKWDSDTSGLEEAQENKFKFYAKRLGIDKNSKGKALLDLGCGWGGLIFYFADHYGLICHGITLSTAQAKYIKDEIKKRGMDGQVGVENINAHDMHGKYDYIISVGLLDHITDYDDLYMKTSRSLKKGGTALFHDMFHHNRFYKPDPFLLKYVFPGGSTAHMKSNLRIFRKYFKHVDRNDLPQLSYPKTLDCWFNNFCRNEGRIRYLLKEKSKCKNIDFAVRVFKHYLMLSYCGLAQSGTVSNILVYN